MSLRVHYYYNILTTLPRCQTSLSFAPHFHNRVTCIMLQTSCLGQKVLLLQKIQIIPLGTYLLE